MTTNSPTSVKDLKAASYNPRTITPLALKKLRASLEKYGDLSGIVFNLHSGVLISGHQRIKSVQGKPTKLVKRTQTRDLQGTVALGVLQVTEPDGSVTSIPYREVSWPDKIAEMAANVAANAAGGDWDEAKLGAILAKLKASPKFDIEDVHLDKTSIARFIGVSERPKTQDDDHSAVKIVAPVDTRHQCPKCGHKFED